MAKRGKQHDAHAAIILARKRFEKTVCSSSWAEALAYGRESLPSGLTPCQHCEKSFPPYYVSESTCYECHIDLMPPSRRAALPSSSSIIRG